MNEINYQEAAKILGCSPRNARRIIGRSNIKPIRHSYRVVAFRRNHIVALKRELEARRQRKLVIRIGGAR